MKEKLHFFDLESGDLMVTYVVGLQRRFVFDLNPFRKFSFVVSTERTIFRIDETYV